MKENLRLEGVYKIYQAENGEVNALEDISFSMSEGEIGALVGPSGCGKSTLLSAIAGIDPPTGGKIWIGDALVEGVSPRIGYMLQKDSLLDWRTIRQNVMLGLEIRGMISPETTDYAEHLLDIYGLGDFMDNYPNQLSGGMRQRAALIRTLATKPDLLLLDEAFSALDYQTRLSVTEDVYRILKKEQKTTLMVTHDIPEGISMADRAIVLTARPGRLKSIHRLAFPGISCDTPMERRNHPDFRGYFNIIWKELDANE